MPYTPVVLPFPGLDDLADGPDGFKDTSDAAAVNFAAIKASLDEWETMKAGAAFDIRAGRTNETAARFLGVQRQVGADAYVTTLSITDATNTCVLQVDKNGVRQAAHWMTTLGQLYTIVGTTTRAHPFAQAAGTDALTFSADVQVTKAINFPAGRFTQPPAVTASCTGGATSMIASPGNITTAGFTIYLRNAAGTALTGSITFAWIACQMLSNSVSG